MITPFIPRLFRNKAQAALVEEIRQESSFFDTSFIDMAIAVDTTSSYIKGE